MSEMASREMKIEELNTKIKKEERNMGRVIESNDQSTRRILQIEVDEETTRDLTQQEYIDIYNILEI